MKLVFQSCCFLMAIYWTALFSSNYSENSDDILITIKEFNHDFEDKYPTFSICIKGTEINWFHGHEIFMAYGFNASKYESMLKGKTSMKYEYDHASKLYKKKPVNVNHGIDVKFNSFHLQTSELLSDLKFTSENVAQIDEKLGEDSNNVTIESNIHLTYQSPDTICFTRNSSDTITTKRIQDLITFNSSNLRSRQNKDVEIQIFIHYPGQLISSFDKPKYTSSVSYLLSSLRDRGSKYNVLNFKVSQCRMLRKREDSANFYTNLFYALSQCSTFLLKKFSLVLALSGPSNTVLEERSTMTTALLLDACVEHRFDKLQTCTYTTRHLDGFSLH